ncbi:MAG TPA: TetR family transcriptional regulator [Dokdonella sp.]
MPRRPNTDQRRAQIVAAALEVIGRLGYEKATVQAIAKEAGLAPGLIHYHFSNKQEILVSLVGSIAEYARTRFEQILGGTLDADERLHAYLKARLALGAGASPSMVAAWVVIGAEAIRQPEVRKIYQRAIAAELDVLDGLIADCLVKRKRDTRQVRPLSAALVAMMAGAFQLSSAAAKVMPVGYAAQAAIDFAMAGIKAAPRLS